MLQDNIEFNALMMEDLTLKYDPYSIDNSPDAQVNVFRTNLYPRPFFQDL